jgi:hypothetical protein
VQEVDPLGHAGRLLTVCGRRWWYPGALPSLFIHKGSAESKDSDEQMQKSLDRIERRLKALEGGEKAGAKSS